MAPRNINNAFTTAWNGILEYLVSFTTIIVMTIFSRFFHLGRKNGRPSKDTVIAAAGRVSTAWHGIIIISFAIIFHNTFQKVLRVLVHLGHKNGRPSTDAVVATVAAGRFSIA